MKNVTINFAILSVVLLLGCDQTEELPTYLSGKVIGTYASGTPFEESFHLTQKTGDVEKFEDTDYGKYLRLTRMQGNSYFSLSLLLQDPGLPTEQLIFLNQGDYAPEEFDFFLQNETSSSTLTEISCSGIVTSTLFRSMSIEANKTYDLVVDTGGDPVLYNKFTSYYKPPLGGEGYTEKIYVFKNTSGAAIYFVSRYGDEASFLKIEYPDGTVNTTDPVYGELSYFEQASVTDKFVRKVGGASVDLFEVYFSQDASASVLNYSYDTSTGRLKFDFTITVSGSGANNSTGHDLTIKGSFDSGNNKIFLDTQN